MNNNYIENVNKLNSIYYLDKYPFNLNTKLKDNIINTKKEIELEYIKNYILTQSKDKKNIKGANEISILIF
jgi:hypothetical protein